MAAADNQNATESHNVATSAVHRLGAGRATATALKIIIAVSLATHGFFLLAGGTWMADWRWPSHAVHGAVEMSGALIAILVAGMLLAVDRRGAGTNFNIWIAGALVGMGLLDGLHALVDAGQTFVWLHSVATLIGGALFALVWAPPQWQARLTQRWVGFVAAGTFTLGVASMLFPGATPPMLVHVESGALEFSIWAKSLNLVGGVLFLAASIPLVQSYRRTGNVDDLLFCLHTALFGAAATLFEQSQLWDLPWWGWHILRLTAFGVALWFVILNEAAAQATVREAAEQLKTFNETLEAKVTARTAQLEAVANELAQSNRELEEFAHVASHDLQEPLRMVRSFAGLLKRDMADELDERRRQYLDYLMDGADRMQHLIRDILDYARAGARDSETEPVALDAILENALENLDEAIREADARVTASPLPTVNGDPTGFLQLFQNLIGNAIKFRGETAPRVDIRAEEQEGGWLLRFADNGIGIEPQYRERIFGAFKRLHDTREFAGSGIGLAVCAKVTLRHGGRIWVESEPGHGSTFLVYLPNRSASGESKAAGK